MGELLYALIKENFFFKSCLFKVQHLSQMTHTTLLPNIKEKLSFLISFFSHVRHVSFFIFFPLLLGNKKLFILSEKYINNLFIWIKKMSFSSFLFSFVHLSNLLKTNRQLKSITHFLWAFLAFLLIISVWYQTLYRNCPNFIMLKINFEYLLYNFNTPQGQLTKKYKKN